MRPNLLLGLLTAALFLVTPALGEACTPTTSNPEVDTGETGSGRYYVDNDPCQPACMFSIWIYQESNGIDGLQRGDEVVDDTCGGMIESDTAPCLLLPVALFGRRRATGSRANAAVLGAALAAGALAAVPTAEAC